MRKSFFTGIMVLAMALCLVSSPMQGKAHALYIDFEMGFTKGGLITVLGPSYATGEDIPISVLKIGGAPFYNGVHATSAVLSFTMTESDNEIKIYGSVPALKIDSPSTLLLWGSFAPASFSVITYEGHDTKGVAVSGGGRDFKGEALLTALGIDPRTQWAFFGFVLGVAPSGESEYKGTSADVQNIYVPEPGVLILLGAGLVGLVGLRRKIRK